jgi:hypothetical protein
MPVTPWNSHTREFPSGGCHCPRIHLSLTGKARGGFSMKPPFNSRFCLMRNQIAIASRRDRTFAIQFFDRLSFMGRFAGEKDVGDGFTELLFG